MSPGVDAGLEPVLHAHVLVVDVDVHVAVQLALAGEELVAGLRVLPGEPLEHLADGEPSTSTSLGPPTEDAARAGS